MDYKYVQCILDRPMMLSKVTQTKPWKESDPKVEQREIVRRYYIDSYGQTSRDSPWKKFDERAEKEAKEKAEKDAKKKVEMDMKVKFRKSYQKDEEDAKEPSQAIESANYLKRIH